MLLWQRLAFPRVNQHHVVFDRTRERQVGRVRDPRAGHVVVAGTEHCVTSVLGTANSARVRNRTPFQWLSIRLQVVTQWKSLTSSVWGRARNSCPCHRKRVLAQSTDFEPPGVERDVGSVAEVEDRPVGHLALADRKFRHAVPVDRAGSCSGAILERDVDAFLMQRFLPFDVSQSLGDQAFVRQSFWLLASAYPSTHLQAAAGTVTSLRGSRYGECTPKSLPRRSESLPLQISRLRFTNRLRAVMTSGFRPVARASRLTMGGTWIGKRHSLARPPMSRKRLFPLRPPRRHPQGDGFDDERADAAGARAVQRFEQRRSRVVGELVDDESGDDERCAARQPHARDIASPHVGGEAEGSIGEPRFVERPGMCVDGADRPKGSASALPPRRRRRRCRSRGRPSPRG